GGGVCWEWRRRCVGAAAQDSNTEEEREPRRATEKKNFGRFAPAPGKGGAKRKTLNLCGPPWFSFFLRVRILRCPLAGTAVAWSGRNQLLLPIEFQQDRTVACDNGADLFGR